MVVVVEGFGVATSFLAVVDSYNDTVTDGVVSGITADDCISVTNALGGMLELAETLDDNLLLEDDLVALVVED